MDDSVCPLCCEELDLSDREFYPCKCGYQVCMWCWHRIRESESGLCPACRTPYGEDPHQFSAVDVEEVLRANKEAEALRKQQQKQDDTGSNGTATNTTSSSSSLPMEVPKDRNLLVNMRVIRRNLVYAVGLPASIATEDILKKPEYFGQYGKISKIVMNRATINNERRASASAYVTFVHKEDTLACILALDGFYMDGRNIRASYGTSKYCSAFIKSVRCNNPECTYLHEMGASEDTFTKQEIQAGYVTSGRDVLARQHQIVAEQLRQSATGSAPPRKRVGGGGPSGTGRASSNPVFPAPEYDEPSRPSTAGLVPTPAGVTRASTTSIPSQQQQLDPATIAAKMGRSASVGRTAVQNTRSKSAASIVAGVHKGAEPQQQVDSHATLTPLTPLKRTTKAAMAQGKGIPMSTDSDTKLVSNRSGLQPLSSNGFTEGPSLIGGDVIAAPPPPPLPLPTQSVSLTSTLGGEVFTGELGGHSKTTIGQPPVSDKWNAIGGTPLQQQPLPQTLWNGSTPQTPATTNNNSSTNVLASILGINLPTGSGSLSQGGLWTSSEPSPLASLNETSTAPSTNSSSALIGGIPIGGGLDGPVGGASSNSYGGKSDIALLQSLLPGVHITNGSETSVSGNNNGRGGSWQQGGSGELGGETIPGWNSAGSSAIGQAAAPAKNPGIW